MPMDREQIKQGKCYIDADKDRYKILDINERGIVTYKTPHSPLRQSAGIKAFAKALVEEIECTDGL
ncbi:MAG TPA: hypothetical protein VFK05_11925 [Polyangiaceae bacterium]|nr:hypothetical protein [Polyangiaceae bacterium]